MKVPEWARFVRVDELIECFPLGAASNTKYPDPKYVELAKKVESALLEAMPNAYGGEPPGEDDWPEPDAKRDEPYKLDKAWDKLSEDVRTALVAAYAARFVR